MTWNRPNPYQNLVALKQPMAMRWRDESGELKHAGKYRTVKGENVLIRKITDDEIDVKLSLLKQPEFFVSWLVENNLKYLVLVNGKKKYYTKVSDWNKSSINDNGQACLMMEKVKEI